MSYVIHIARPGRPDAWATWTKETETESEACAFGTEEAARRIMELSGLYRLMGWTTTVRSSKVEPNVPGVGSNFSYTDTQKRGTRKSRSR